MNIPYNSAADMQTWPNAKWTVSDFLKVTALPISPPSLLHFSLKTFALTNCCFIMHNPTYHSATAHIL